MDTESCYIEITDGRADIFTSTSNWGCFLLAYPRSSTKGSNIKLSLVVKGPAAMIYNRSSKFPRENTYHNNFSNFSRNYKKKLTFTNGDPKIQIYWPRGQVRIEESKLRFKMEYLRKQEKQHNSMPFQYPAELGIWLLDSFFSMKCKLTHQ